VRRQLIYRRSPDRRCTGENKDRNERTRAAPDVCRKMSEKERKVWVTTRTTLKLNKRGIHVPHPGASADHRAPKVESG